MGRHPHDHSALPLLRAAFAPARADFSLPSAPVGAQSGRPAERVPLGPFCSLSFPRFDLLHAHCPTPHVVTLYIDRAPLELGIRLQEDVASRTAALSLRLGDQHVGSRWAGKARGRAGHIFVFSVPPLVDGPALNPTFASGEAATNAWVVLDSSVGCWRAGLRLASGR